MWGDHASESPQTTWGPAATGLDRVGDDSLSCPFFYSLSQLFALMALRAARRPLRAAARFLWAFALGRHSPPQVDDS